MGLKEVVVEKVIKSALSRLEQYWINVGVEATFETLLFEREHTISWHRNFAHELLL